MNFRTEGDFYICWSDGESVEQQLTIIPRVGNKRRRSLADHAFPELHQKVVHV